MLESYVKRLEELENHCQFIQRRGQVLCDPGRQGNPDSWWRTRRSPTTTTVMLCKDIIKKIEAELAYPGQIKVTVIRETRVSDFAR